MSADGGSANDLDVDLAAESFHHDSASDNVGLSGGGEDIDFDSFAEADGTLHDHLLAQVGERFGGIEAIVAGQLVALIDEAGYLRADLAELAAQLGVPLALVEAVLARSEEHTSELQSLMRISYAVFCLKKKKTTTGV